MIISEKAQFDFENAKSCHICNKVFPVRNHCHVTGKYKGSAHNVCNRSY